MIKSLENSKKNSPRESSMMMTESNQFESSSIINSDIMKLSSSMNCKPLTRIQIRKKMKQIQSSYQREEETYESKQLQHENQRACIQYTHLVPTHFHHHSKGSGNGHTLWKLADYARIKNGKQILERLVDNEFKINDQSQEHKRSRSQLFLRTENRAPRPPKEQKSATTQSRVVRHSLDLLREPGKKVNQFATIRQRNQLATAYTTAKGLKSKQNTSVARPHSQASFTSLG